MKIILCCRVYSTHQRPGGMIHVVTERAEELARQGHSVYVLTTRSEHCLPIKTVNGVHVNHCLGGVPQQYSDQYAEFCVKVCSSLNPNIIHLDSWDKSRLWWTPFRKVCRVAITNHGEAVGSQLTDWRLQLHGKSPSTLRGLAPESEYIDTDEWLEERDQLLQADTVISTCRFDRWMLSDLLALPNVKFVPNPLSPYHFENQVKARSWETIKGSQLQCLCVGVWGHGERGFDAAQFACDVVGAELKVPKNVNRRELVEWYDRSDALLLPGYQSKGYDLAVAESIARLRPVIMADNGIATMEAVDQPWIVTVPAGDVSALVKVLRQPLPAVPTLAAERFRPGYHVKEWLKAITL